MNTANDLRDSNCGGFYHWPALWIGDPPTERGDDLTRQVMNLHAFTHEFACGVRVTASRAALFLFDFRNWAEGSAASMSDSLENWENLVFARMRFLNLFLACFYTSVYRHQKRVIPKMFVDYATYVAADSPDPESSSLHTDGRQFDTVQAIYDSHRRSKVTCDVVKESVLPVAAEMTENAIAHGSRESATLAELLLHSFHLYENGKYEASHIAGWTITERCLNDQWQAWLSQLDEQHSEQLDPDRFINADRKKKLTGPDFTASIISECLSLAGLLPFEAYKHTCRVRQARNRWLHKLQAIDRTAAADSIVLAQNLLRRANIIDLEIPFQIIGTLPIAWQTEETD